MGIKSPLIVGSGLSALGLVALDVVATGGAATAAGVAGCAVTKGLEVVTALGSSLAIDALKERFSGEADYREIQSNTDLYRVLHQAVAHIIQEAADEIDPVDSPSAKALRFIATSGNPLIPIETLSIVEIFATTTGSLRTSGAGTDGKAETLSTGEWERVFSAFVKRAKKLRGWREGRHHLRPEVHAPVLYKLHTHFPRAVRNVTAQDAATEGRAFAKLNLLMLGEVLALVRERRDETSGETAQAAKEAERILVAAVETSFDALSAELRAELAPLHDRFGRLESMHGETHRKLDDVSDGVNQLLARDDLDRERPVRSLAPNKRTDHFMGREDAIAETLSKLDAHPVVFVCGPGGIGKSTLVRHLYDDALRGRWAPDRVDYIDLNTQKSASGVIGTVTAALSMKGVTDATSLMRGLAGRGARLYLLDDLQQALADDPNGIRDLLDTLTAYRGDMRVLVTMRSKPHVQGACVLHPGKLQPPHDAALFRALTAERLSNDPEPLAALLKELDGYPLAIELAAGRLPIDGSVADLLAAWHEQRTRLLQRPGSNKHDRLSSLDVSLGLSYDALSEYSSEARALFVTFADLPAGASPALLKALLGFDGEDAAESLFRLGLLHREGGRYTALAPIRHYADSRRNESPEAGAMRKRLDQYLLEFVENNFTPENWISSTHFGSTAEAVGVELPNLYAALRRASSNDQDVYMAKMMYGLRRYIGRKFGSDEVLDLIGDASKAASRAELYEEELGCVITMAGIYCRRGDLTMSREVYLRARSLSREKGDRMGEAKSEKGISETYMDEGNYIKANSHSRTASHIFKCENSYLGYANSLKDLAVIDIAAGHAWRALDLVSHACDMYSSANMKEGLANGLRVKGDALHAVSRVRDAIECYVESLELLDHRGPGYATAAAMTYLSLGRANLSIGQTDAASEHLSRSIALFISTSDAFGHGLALLTLGEVELARDDKNSACGSLKEGVRILDTLGLANRPDALRARELSKRYCGAPVE